MSLFILDDRYFSQQDQCMFMTFGVRNVGYRTQSIEQLALGFQRKPIKAVLAVLETLEAMNLARHENEYWLI